MTDTHKTINKETPVKKAEDETTDMSIGVSSLRSKSKDELFGFTGAAGAPGFAGLDSVLKDNGAEKEDLAGNKY
jgi:hypothetical protein